MRRVRTTARLGRGLFVAVDGVVIAVVAVFAAGAADSQAVVGGGHGELGTVVATLSVWLSTPGVGPYELVASAGLLATILGPLWYWLLGPVVLSRIGPSRADALGEPELFEYEADDEPDTTPDEADDFVYASEATGGRSAGGRGQSESAGDAGADDAQGETDWEGLLGAGDTPDASEFTRGSTETARSPPSAGRPGEPETDREPQRFTIEELRELSATSGPHYARPSSGAPQPDTGVEVAAGDASVSGDSSTTSGSEPAPVDAAATDDEPEEVTSEPPEEETAPAEEAEFATAEEVVETLFAPAVETETLPALSVSTDDPESSEAAVEDTTDDTATDEASPTPNEGETTGEVSTDDPESSETAVEDKTDDTATDDAFPAPNEGETTGEVSTEPPGAGDATDDEEDAATERQPEEAATDDMATPEDPFDRLSRDLAASRAAIQATGATIADAAKANGTGGVDNAIAAIVAEAHDRLEHLQRLGDGGAVDLHDAIGEVRADQQRIEDAFAEAFDTD